MFCQPISSVRKFDLNDVRAFDRERRGAHSQIELPVAQESTVMAERYDFVFLRAHASRPFPKRPRIILTERKRIADFEARAFGFLTKALQRRQHAAGKHIIPDEIAA